jgi:hypothetical protein
VSDKNVFSLAECSLAVLFYGTCVIKNAVISFVKINPAHNSAVYKNKNMQKFGILSKYTFGVGQNVIRMLVFESFRAFTATQMRSALFWDWLTLEEETDRSSRNVGAELSFYAA